MKYKPQVQKSHYFSLQYDTKERWISYWYQIYEVLRKKPQKMLEIGIGNRLVSHYLKVLGISITTCDFDKDLKPDILADVRNMPFRKNEFDVILCAEVLEHIPYDNFESALIEIGRVTKKWAIITLPHYSLTDIYFGCKCIPFIARTQALLKIPFPVKHRFEGQHYWEIGKRGFPLKKVIAGVRNSGFNIEKHYIPVENPYHHFFVLKKK